MLLHLDHREPPKLWRRIRAETVLELSLVVDNWKPLLAGIVFQGSKRARLPAPESAIEVLIINFSKGVNYGCGDLIFSSHMIFTIVFVRTYHKYGTKRCIKQFAWLLAVIQSLLIIASRKHYTVDIVVAWYTVNLVTFFIDHKLPELPDRATALASAPMLPVTRDKDSRNLVEQENLLSGISVDTTN